MSLDSVPTIVIPQHVYDKIMWWVQHADGEVSGMGTVQWNPETREFVVDDAMLLEQTCSAASTTLAAGAVGRAEYATREHAGEGMRWWWHSHVNMSVFWSGTDTATIEELGEHGWFLATVFNKREESKSCIYQGKPFPFFTDALPLEVVPSEVDHTPDVVEAVAQLELRGWECMFVGPPITPAMEAEWLADYEACVTTPPPTTYGQGGYGGGRYWNWNQTLSTPRTPPATVSPADDDGVIYTRAEATSWMELHQRVSAQLDSSSVANDEFDRMMRRLDDIELVLEQFQSRGLIEQDEMDKLYYGTYGAID